jgi:uncharacterized protein YndB with AHSA1/START domain
MNEESIRLRARLPAPIGAVRRGLVDAAALRHWLAEHAEVEPPGRYAFWGRYTPQGEEPRQRLLHLDDRTLRLSWRLSGEETTVEVLLEEESADSTVVTLSQTCSDREPAGYPMRLVLTVFWSLALGNLIDHLTGRPITPPCDHTARELRTEVTIAAPRTAVFGSLVDSAEFGRWFGIPVEIEPYAGGAWSIPDGGPIGTVREVEPNRRLSLQEDTGIATWTLADDGEGTLLTFDLSGFAPDRPPYPSWTAWLSALSSLRRYHELDDWQPAWLTD